MSTGQLTNTDTFRLNALEDALRNGTKDNPLEVSAVSPRTIQRLKYFIPSFKQALSVYNEALLNHTCKEDNYHFLRGNVVAALRQLIAKVSTSHKEEVSGMTTKKQFSYIENIKKCAIESDEDIINTGKLLLEGEHMRVLDGGEPLQEPRIAIVKIKYDQFAEVYRAMQFTRQTLERAKIKLSEARIEADDIIMCTWKESDTVPQAELANKANF